MYNLLAERIVNSLSWTLIHSLWQGFILAMTAAIFMQIAKKTKPQTRYNFLLLLFSIQLILSVTTFFILSRSQHSALSVSTGNLRGANPEAVIPLAEGGIGAAGFFLRMVLFLNQHALLIVNCWFFIMAILSIKMSVGILYLKKIKRTKYIATNTYWEECIAKMAKSANIKRVVRMAESGLVKTPMVAGYLKPLIMLPIGLLSDYNLSQSQIEAILYHELAHIRRHDYVVNLLQSVAEIIFFFNPFVWWLSSLLRDEREYCCDADVVGKFSDKRTMVAALVAFQESKQRLPKFAMALWGGDKYKLLQRAKQLFHNRHDGISSTAKIILTSCCVIFFSGILAIYGIGQQQPKPDTARIQNHEKVSVQSEEMTRVEEGKTRAEEAKVREQEEITRQQEAITRGEEAITRDKEEGTRGEERKTREREEVVRQQEEKMTQDQERLAAEEEKRGDILINSILDDLIKNKIITVRDGASFLLSDSTFIVNNKVQSPAIQTSFFGRYGSGKKAIFCNYSK